MTYNVVISAHAEDDLRGIYEYIAFELLSPGTAAKQIERLETGICKLDIFPYKYPAYKEEPWHSRGLRFFPVDNYIVFYIPDDAEQVVTVIRVIYCGRDIEKQLTKLIYE